jgi:hypothetical protein
VREGHPRPVRRHEDAVEAKAALEQAEELRRVPEVLGERLSE